MREIEINRQNLALFLENIRPCDLNELIYFLGPDYKDKFISNVLDNKQYTYFLAYNSIPCCIGGFCEDKSGAQVWLLCGNKYDKKFLWKYLNDKFNKIKKSYDFIYNYIYASNFKSINMLLRLGFKIIDTNNSDLKLFYYKRR